MKKFLTRDTEITVRDIATTFVALIAVRIGVDYVLHGADAFTARSFFLMAVHTVTFFGIAYLLIASFFARISGLPLMRASHLTILAFFFIVLPPIIDAVISHYFLNDVAFWSYYIFDTPLGLAQRYITFFGADPTNGITYGTRVMTACAVIGFGALTWIGTRSAARALVCAIGIYTILFVLGALPSLVAYLSLMHEQAVRTIDDVTIAGFFLSPTLAFSGTAASFAGMLNLKLAIIYMILLPVILAVATVRYEGRVVMAFIRNMRPSQIVYHWGLLTAGFMLAITFGGATITFTPFTIISLVAIYLAVAASWIGAVCFNDIIDQPIDEISNPHRPLITGIFTAASFSRWGIVLMFFAVVIVFLVAPHAIVFLVGYLGLSWIYSMPPLRLKKFPVIGTFIAACASMMIVLMSYVIIAQSQTLADFPVAIGVAFLAVLTVVLPLKDLKDILGDSYNRVYTIPVLLGQKKARLLLGACFFLAYALTTRFFHQTPILLAALASGTVSFWILTSRRGDRFAFHARELHSLVLLVGSIFFVIFVTTIFLS